MVENVNKEDLENSLKTREQVYKERKRDKMFVSRKQITSKAFLSLKTAAACQVLMIFLNKCRYEKVQIKPGTRDKEWRITNNGEIQFTYTEAKQKYGISAGRFTRAIDNLVEKGLIDIEKSGFGLHKDITLYAISNRWEKYGTDEFVPAKRPRRPEQLGFSKGNIHGKNSKPKMISTCTNNC